MTHHDWDELDSFPNTPLFQIVLDLANRCRLSKRTTVTDHAYDIEANQADLLADVQQFRPLVLQALSPTTRKTLKEGHDVFICLQAPAGYDWLVGYLTIMSIGAAVVPLSSTAMDEELRYFIDATNAAAILFSSSILSTASPPTLLTTPDGSCAPVAIPDRTGKRPAEHASPFQLSARTLDPKGIGYALFSSGSTGRPKGVRHHRGSFVSLLRDTVAIFGLSDQDVGMLHMAGHWVRGVSAQLMFLLSEARVEYSHGRWTPEWMWAQIRTGRVTCVLDGAGDYRRMIDYYDQHISHRSAAEIESYTMGMQSLRLPCIGGTPLSRTIWDAWNRIPGTHALVNDYGTSESFSLMTTFPASKDGLLHHVGHPWPGVETKLSDGESGELMVRTRDMFAGYVNGPSSEGSTWTEDGFFRTGDYVQKQGNEYFLLGRISLDLIRFDGWRVPAIEVEDAITSLPYVQETMVVPISDEFSGQRVAAIIRPRETSSSLEITLSRLRKDLHSRGLFAYKLPTVLRCVGVDETLPRTQTGKPAKKKAVEMYLTEGEVEVWEEEEEESGEVRAWDWAGI